jgi:hypothetical protein
MRQTLLVSAVAAILGGCSAGTQGPTTAPPGAGNPLPSTSGMSHASAVHHAVGVGKILTSKNSQQIFGFDVDRNGTDGVLATAFDVETFDQSSGQITSSFKVKRPPGTQYEAEGIFDGDVALIKKFVFAKGQQFPKRVYSVMKPVTAKKFTGPWTSPIKDIDVLQVGVNQTTSTSALFAIELQNQDQPDIIVTNVGANTVSKVIHLDPNLFGGGNIPQFAQDSGANEGVIALSPDGGRVGGFPPINALVDLTTGKVTKFSGFNGGPFGAGYVNGLAVDSSTHVAVTTTELNAQVEFYDLSKRIGINTVQLPCTSDSSQINSGAGIANDPVNGLFLVTDPSYACSSGSALVVYDEKGNLVETITGFKFAIGEPAPVINPSTRTGWAFGPGFNQLQEFTY